MALPSFRRRSRLAGAIAFGEEGARVLVGRVEAGGVRVVSCVSVPGAGADADGLRSLQAALPSAVGGWVCVAPRGSYGLHVLARPAVPADELRDSLRWAVAPMIDFPPEEAVVEYMAIPRAPGPEMGDSVYVVVAARAAMRALAMPVEAAQRPLAAIDIAENVQRNVLARASHARQAACLVVPDDDGVQFSFVVDGELYLDRYIAGALPDPDHDRWGGERAYERVQDSLQRSLDVIARGTPALSPARIVVAPGWAALAERLRGALPVPVEMLALDALFDFAAAPELADGRRQTRWLNALGALLRAAEARA